MKSYAHMCRDGHPEIGHNDSSDDERCPVCRVLDDRDQLRAQLAEAQMRFGRHRECGGDVVVPDPGSGSLVCEKCGAQDWRSDAGGTYVPKLLDEVDTETSLQAARDTLTQQLAEARGAETKRSETSSTGKPNTTRF